MAIEVGDLVVRQSYGKDIVFYVRQIEGGPEPLAQLIGANVRLLADSPLDDLLVLASRSRPTNLPAVKALINQLSKGRDQSLTQAYYKDLPGHPGYTPFPGKVLHVDGEQHYLEQCLTLYRSLGVPVTGLHIGESVQPQKIRDVLAEYNPDILVITGHDGLLRKQSSRDFLAHYRTSNYFVETVKQARLFDSNRDGLAIIAGACQSYFERLIDAGANFATAPERVMIHCLDPVFVAEKLAYTPFTQVVNLPELFHATISGKDGIGGIETRGKFRQGYPPLTNWGGP